MATGRAPGKLILLGEHAVVAGHPALAAAVDRFTDVTLRGRPGPSGLDSSTLVDDRLWPALATLLPPTGIGVSIRSDLPVGCGMGSSAALAVALVRALAIHEGRVATFDECFERAFAVERVFHGTPSGVDHAVSAHGGVVRYVRAGPMLHPVPLSLPFHLVVADTGAPGNTAEMVARVRARGAEAEFREIAALVAEAEARLPDIGPLMQENQRLLRAIGVSTPKLDAVCAAMENAGAFGAKLAGAGGGGVAIAAVALDGVARVKAAAEAVGCHAFLVTIGPAEG